MIPDGLEPGDTFNVSVPDKTRVTCSNLPTVPATRSRWPSPSSGPVSNNCSRDGSTRHRSTEKAGSLLQQAQAQLIQQAIQQGCNAVLGVTFNVAIKNLGVIRANRFT